MVRMAFHEHPDSYRFPGVDLNPEEYWATPPKRRTK
jgi:hypothetical protein